MKCQYHVDLKCRHKTYKLSYNKNRGNGSKCLTTISYILKADQLLKPWVMDCHVTAWGSIPGGNGVFTELHVLRKGQ